eukprot:g3784.t1
MGCAQSSPPPEDPAIFEGRVDAAAQEKAQGLASSLAAERVREAEQEMQAKLERSLEDEGRKADVARKQERDQLEKELEDRLASALAELETQLGAEAVRSALSSSVVSTGLATGMAELVAKRKAQQAQHAQDQAVGQAREETEARLGEEHAAALTEQEARLKEAGARSALSSSLVGRGLATGMAMMVAERQAQLAEEAHKEDEAVAVQQMAEQLKIRVASAVSEQAAEMDKEVERRASVIADEKLKSFRSSIALEAVPLIEALDELLDADDLTTTDEEEDGGGGVDDSGGNGSGSGDSGHDLLGKSQDGVDIVGHMLGSALGYSMQGGKRKFASRLSVVGGGSMLSAPEIDRVVRIARVRRSQVALDAVGWPAGAGRSALGRITEGGEEIDGPRRQQALLTESDTPLQTIVAAALQGARVTPDSDVSRADWTNLLDAARGADEKTEEAMATLMTAFTDEVTRVTQTLVERGAFGPLPFLFDNDDGGNDGGGGGGGFGAGAGAKSDDPEVVEIDRPAAEDGQQKESRQRFTHRGITYYFTAAAYVVASTHVPPNDRTCEHSAAVAGVNQKGAAAVMEAALDTDICFPLQAVVDYLGVRVVASSTLPPMEEDGSIDGDEADDGFREMLVDLATRVNHHTMESDGVYDEDADEKLHELGKLFSGVDGKLYLDPSGTWLPNEDSSAAPHLPALHDADEESRLKKLRPRHVRPEWLLEVDGGDAQTVLIAAASRIDAIAGDARLGGGKALTAEIHRVGVNCRHLGLALTPSSLDELLLTISNSRHLTALNLADNAFGVGSSSSPRRTDDGDGDAGGRGRVSGPTQVANFMSKMVSADGGVVAYLNLRGTSCGEGAGAAQALADAVAVNTSLEWLDVLGDRFCADADSAGGALTSFVVAFADHAKLVDPCGLPASEESIVALSSLDLSNQGLDAGDALLLAAGLPRASHVSRLLLDRNELAGPDGDDAHGIAWLAAALEAHGSVTEVNLLRNGFAPKAAAVFTEGPFRTNRGIRTLSGILSSELAVGKRGLHLEPGDGVLLAADIEHNPRMTVLDLSHNRLRGVGVSAILKALRTNITLTSVSLAHNRVWVTEEDGATAKKNTKKDAKEEEAEEAASEVAGGTGDQESKVDEPNMTPLETVHEEEDDVEEKKSRQGGDSRGDDVAIMEQKGAEGDGGTSNSTAPDADEGGRTANEESGDGENNEEANSADDSALMPPSDATYSIWGVDREALARTIANACIGNQTLTHLSLTGNSFIYDLSEAGLARIGAGLMKYDVMPGIFTGEDFAFQHQETDSESEFSANWSDDPEGSQALLDARKKKIADRRGAKRTRLAEAARQWLVKDDYGSWALAGRHDTGNVFALPPKRPVFTDLLAKSDLAERRPDSKASRLSVLVPSPDAGSAAGASGFGDLERVAAARGEEEVETNRDRGDEADEKADSKRGTPAAASRSKPAGTTSRREQLLRDSKRSSAAKGSSRNLGRMPVKRASSRLAPKRTSSSPKM